MEIAALNDLRRILIERSLCQGESLRFSMYGVASRTTTKMMRLAVRRLQTQLEKRQE